MAYGLALLSVLAGIPKIVQLEQELEFLNAIGFSGILVSMLGIVQVIGGLLLLLQKTRLVGAILAGVAFLVSSIAIFSNGNAAFGMFSLVPFILLVVVILSSGGRTSNTNQ